MQPLSVVLISSFQREQEKNGHFTTFRSNLCDLFLHCDPYQRSTLCTSEFYPWSSRVILPERVYGSFKKEMGDNYVGLSRSKVDFFFGKPKSHLSPIMHLFSKFHLLLVFTNDWCLLQQVFRFIWLISWTLFEMNTGYRSSFRGF